MATIIRKKFGNVLSPLLVSFTASLFVALFLLTFNVLSVSATPGVGGIVVDTVAPVDSGLIGVVSTTPSCHSSKAIGGSGSIGADYTISTTVHTAWSCNKISIPGDWTPTYTNGGVTYTSGPNGGTVRFSLPGKPNQYSVPYTGTRVVTIFVSSDNTLHLPPTHPSGQ